MAGFKPQHKTFALTPMKGFETQADILLRDPKSWSLLLNFELTVPGSIRKVLGDLAINDNVYDSPIVAIRRYARSEADLAFPLLIGISMSGKIYNLIGGDLLGDYLHNVNHPFVAELTGNFGNAIIQYLVSTTANMEPRKWDGISAGSTEVGLRAPEHPVEVLSLGLTNSADRGISVLASRRYRFTFWDPVRRRDSSPSTDELNAAIASFVGGNPSDDGSTPSQPSNVHATIEFPYIAMVVMGIRESSPTGRVRFWATHDGGDEFFLVEHMISVSFPDDDISNPVWVEADEFGSLPDRAFRYYDGVRDTDLDVHNDFGLPIDFDPSVQGGFKPRIPQPDPVLVEPAPELGENDPPPRASWGAVYQGRLFFVDAARPNRLVFSKPDDWESFPVDNFIEFPQDDQDPIVALHPEYNRLVIGNVRSSYQLIGTDFRDFVVLPYDPQVGFIGRRLVTDAQGRMMFFSRQGLMLMGEQGPTFYGERIKPFTDQIDRAEAFERLQACVDSQQGIAIFTFARLSPDLQENDFLILADISEESPFSIVTQSEFRIHTIQEVEEPDGTISILVGREDNKVYRLWQPANSNVSAFAVTQFLPMDDITGRKVFRRLKTATGADFAQEFMWTYQVDSNTQVPLRPLRRDNYIGATGRRITIYLYNTSLIPQPVLSDLVLEYAVVGESR